MKFNQTNDFLYQLFTLIAAIIIVHAVYVAVIRPNAEALLEEQRIQQQAGESYEVKRSVFIVIKDFEQEACFILALWVVAIIGLKGRIALSERRLLNRSLLEVAPGATILPEDIRQYVRPLQALAENERNTCCRARCRRPCNASVPPRTYRTCRRPFGRYARRNPTGWIPNSP